MKQLLIITLLAGTLAIRVHADAESAYVGRDACAECHPQQIALWQGSHHDLAMQPATKQTVLGDFSGVKFRYAGVVTTFYRKDNKYMVSTDGPDGDLHDYEVKYTFGATPLQQYLVEYGNGRMQALTIAWDTRPQSAGGQRWFHLYPDEEIIFTDELHWTKPNFNWNGMCAECHSTNLRKNYSSDDDSFQTTWSEIDVSCEACHGPASRHVDWARKKPGGPETAGKALTVTFDERSDVSWVINEKTGNAQRSRERTSEKEIEVCAQCHSRRSPISDDYQPGRPFTDHYMPRLLDQGMYFADGQIQDEVYVYGSFLQSKMYHSGVTCSDCHEPHSLQLSAEANGVCLQCHDAAKFDNPAHHHHKPGSQGTLCAECHMPPRTYMVVDPRHDHSLRIPRPDLSVTLGTPNACNNCHQDRDAAWALSSLQLWHLDNKKGYQQFARALDAGREAKADAGKQLLEVINDVSAPAIAKAAALSLMPSYLDDTNFVVVQQALQYDIALIRIAVVGVLETLPSHYKVPLAFPILSDNSRAVRIEAARILASLPAGDLSDEQKTVFDKAMADYVHSQQVNADRPEAQMNLGNYYIASGDLEQAEAAYKKALALDGSFVAARINLADLYRREGKDKAALEVLQQAELQSPDNADVRYALGLTYVRLQQNDSALAALESAAGLAPDNANYSYVYAIALNSADRQAEAIKVMQQAHNRFPENRNILQSLVSLHREGGNELAATNYMKKLQHLQAESR